MGAWPSHEQAFLPGGSPAFSSGLQCLHSHLGPQCKCLGALHQLPEKQQGVLGMESYKQPSSAPTKGKPFLTSQKEDSKAYPWRSQRRRWVYSFSSFVKVPRHSASWSNEQDSAGGASVAWMPQILFSMITLALSGLAQQLLSSEVLDVSLDGGKD